MWSPKRNRNGARNRAYESMRLVQPGDIIFSFAGGLIKALGIATSNCYENPKPSEFGRTGENWSNIGWRVDVKYIEYSHPIRPKSHIETLLPFLPPKYSPLQKIGNGNQTFYLLDINRDLAVALAQLIDKPTLDLITGVTPVPFLESDTVQENLLRWEDAVECSIASDTAIPETTKETLIKSRRGQGKYRKSLLLLETACRVTKVNRVEHLIASHTKPWRNCSNEERLDPENGFMLTPTVDHLFDRGFISFENSGELLVSPAASKKALEEMGIPVKKRINVGDFTDGQKSYLEWHRDSILLANLMDEKMELEEKVR